MPQSLKFLRKSILFGCSFVLFGCTQNTKDLKASATGPEPPTTSFVDVFIGTERGEDEHPGARGNTHPGASSPWGMVSCTPQTFDFRKMRLAAGYQDGSDSIYGFSCVNFSGIGCPAAGSVPFKFASGAFDKDGQASTFSQQKAEPGHYSVYLNDEDIHVEASVTTRSVIFNLAQPKGRNSIFLDLTAQQGQMKGGEILEHANDFVNGYQLEGTFCGTTTKSNTYFHAELSQKADSVYLVYENQAIANINNQMDKSKPSGIVYLFDHDRPTTMNLKVGISFVSETNAKMNLDAEQTGFDFEKVRKNAHNQWETELQKIKVTTDNLDDKTVFYSALYRSLLMPITFSDSNGEYIQQQSKGKVGKATDHVRYTAFSLWDTYRTLHPLLTLVYPERQIDMVKTMLGMYKEAGNLPKWEIFAQEPNIMVGDPASIVIADTYIKGLDDFDIDFAYRAMVRQADVVEGNFVRRGLEEYLKLGYIPMDGAVSDVSNFQWKNGIVWGPVSTTMELNLADFGIAQVAKKLGRQEAYKKYFDRSMSFLQLYDPDLGLIRPKNKDGSWYEPFDPEKDRWEKMNFGLRGGPGFVEGSAWQYLYSIPHGIDTLRSVMGEKKFLSQLNRLFDEGHFDMTNEPGLGFPFMYNYTTEKNTKTPSTVHQCLETHFRNVHNGLPGNDDAGTMSAWVVFAMMGLYPDTPGEPDYMVTTPTFETIRIKLNSDFYSGDEFVIERRGPKEGGIKSITLDDTEIGHAVNHFDITGKTSSLQINMEALGEL